MEEFYKDNYKCKLKEIIFDPKYRNFAVSWVNEINRNFISISCFAQHIEKCMYTFKNREWLQSFTILKIQKYNMNN